MPQKTPAKQPRIEETTLLQTSSPVVSLMSPRMGPEAGADPDSAEPAATSMELSDFWTYPADIWQRSVLFWDVLRKRANIMLEHEEAGMPPVLTFQYEMLLDARRFEHPANYALLRITTVGEEHAQDCVDETKPPVIVIDPRAGHGPGIGGFKRLS